MAKNRREAERWVETAVQDLAAAEVLLSHGLFAHACFLSQQCGEKAVKAVWYALDLDPWGHSVQRLIQDLPADQRPPALGTLLPEAARLDKFYIPTRYPNGLPDLTPGESYFRADAEEAVQMVRRLLAACRDTLGAAG